MVTLTSGEKGRALRVFEFDFACGSYSVARCACISICRLKMAGEDKSTWVERAKLAEQAERYDDMAKVGIDYNSHT